MSVVEDRFDFSDLYALTTAIVLRDLTVEPYWFLCEALFKSSFHRTWLIAGLLQKAKRVSDEPDTSCSRFLSQKIRSGLNLTDSNAVPTEDQLTEDLPFILEFVPTKDWENPAALWNCVLNRVQDEYGLSESPKGSDYPADSEAVQLGLFFYRLFNLEGMKQIAPSSAVQSKTLAAIKELLEPWRKSPHHVWLKASYDSYYVSHQMHCLSSHNPLNDCDLYNKMQAMNSYDKQRFVYFCDVDAIEEPVWFENLKQEKPQMLEWHFNIPLTKRRSLGFYVQGIKCGQVAFSPVVTNQIRILESDGFLAALASKETPLFLKQAASSHEADFVRLSLTTSISVRPIERNRIQIMIRWSKPERGHGSLQDSRCICQ